MRLIDADTLIEDLEYDIELDTRALDDTDLLLGIDRENAQFDKDCKQNAIDMLKKAPTVDAIPIDWIEKWLERYSYRNYRREIIEFMVTEWKHEQEKQK